MQIWRHWSWTIYAPSNKQIPIKYFAKNIFAPKHCILTVRNEKWKLRTHLSKYWKLGALGVRTASARSRATRTRHTARKVLKFGQNNCEIWKIKASAYQKQNLSHLSGETSVDGAPLRFSPAGKVGYRDCEWKRSGRGLGCGVLQ